MGYGRINWTNTADTPLNAKNLNTMDTGIYNNEQSINTLEGLITYHNLTVDCFKDNYRVTGGTKKTTENGCIQIEGTRTTTTLYRNLLDNKVIDNDRLMLIKLRIKRNNSSILLITFKYTTEDDEVYVIKDNIVASNLRTSSTIPSYSIEEDDNYHGVWCIFKSSKAIQIKSIAVELSLTVDVTISNFQAFYSMDKVESSSITNVMEFISEIVNISDTDEYKLTAKDIANSSPVYVSVKAKSTGSEDTIIRSDGEDLVDVLTGNVVNGTMTDIQITAEDVIAGIKATNDMSVQIKYYNANCEDLLQMINRSGNGSGYVETNYQHRYTGTTQTVSSGIYTISETEGEE